jgi:hypothetical protein
VFSQVGHQLQLGDGQAAVRVYGACRSTHGAAETGDHVGEHELVPRVAGGGRAPLRRRARLGHADLSPGRVRKAVEAAAAATTTNEPKASRVPVTG